MHLWMSQENIANLREKVSEIQELVIQTDGACLNNPGNSACAACFFHIVEGKRRKSPLFSASLSLGPGTNNIAEYMGIVLALSVC